MPILVSVDFTKNIWPEFIISFTDYQLEHAGPSLCAENKHRQVEGT